MMHNIDISQDVTSNKLKNLIIEHGLDKTSEEIKHLTQIAKLNQNKEVKYLTKITGYFENNERS